MATENNVHMLTKWFKMGTQEGQYSSNDWIKESLTGEVKALPDSTTVSSSTTIQHGKSAATTTTEPRRLPVPLESIPDERDLDSSINFHYLRVT